MQKKSAEKRSQNIKEKKIIRQIIEERLGCDDLNEIIDNLIDRAKNDSRDFEVLQSAMGQKPVDKVEQINVDAAYTASVEYVNKLMSECDE